MLLGIVLIASGIIVLGDLALVTAVSRMFLGVAAIVAGAFEIIHAFWTKGWGGFTSQILLGILYVAFGVVLVQQPVAGALTLPYVLGLVFVASGAIRVLVGIGQRRSGGRIMVLSGLFGCLAGMIILTGFPQTSLWVLGLMLGVDLIVHGVAWLTYAWLPVARAA